MLRASLEASKANTAPTNPWHTYASSRRLQEVAKNYVPKAPYPDGNQLAARLKLTAQLIDAGLGARIFYVSLANFDTHAAQAPAHANLLTQLSQAVHSFWQDLAARGHKDRLLIMTFSEFGRRAKENGSGAPTTARGHRCS